MTSGVLTYSDHDGQRIYDVKQGSVLAVGIRDLTQRVVSGTCSGPKLKDMRDNEYPYTKLNYEIMNWHGYGT